MEASSTFSFQPTRWLGDVAPHWLTGELRQAVIVAKAAALRRETSEAKIPQHLLYTEGWPRTIPTRTQASLLGEIRREVASAVGIEVGYTEPLEVIRRYEELLSSRVGRSGAIETVVSRKQSCPISIEAPRLCLTVPKYLSGQI